MLFFENTSFGLEGLNTHVLAWTICVSLSNFLDMDFYFDCELPCSTPPDYASHPDYKDRFGVLLNSERSLVSQVLDIPARRVFEVDREVTNKIEYQVIWSHFGTTQEVKDKLEGSFLWDAFAVGRFPVVREELQTYDLVEWTHTKCTSPAAFYFLPRAEKQALLDSVKLRYRSDIESLASKVLGELGTFNAVHTRLGDFLKNYATDDYSVDVERWRKYVDATLPDRETPVFVATDALQERELFEQIFAGRKIIFIDELVFGEYRNDYLALEFTDFNSLTILNQLICSAASTFIGTYRSTFTGIIHRLRQERYGKSDFNYFPDGRVSALLNDQMEIVPDSSGFFDWNRFSVFSREHSDIGFMREWDHSRTMIDL